MKFTASLLLSLGSATQVQIGFEADADAGALEAQHAASLALLEDKDMHIHHHKIKHVVDTTVAHYKDYAHLKLPKEVASLLHSRRGDGDVSLGDDAIKKARGILNGMMESAQDELDAKTMECKEFKERNRGAWHQVTTDLMRLQQQITDLEGVKQESISEISKATEFVNETEEESHKEQVLYDSIRQTDEDEMVWRRNDLKVAEFLLKLTKCKGTPALIQTEKSSRKVQKCAYQKNGQVHHKARFVDKRINSAFLAMSKTAKQAAKRALLSSTENHADMETVASEPAPAMPAGGPSASPSPAPPPEMPTEGSSAPASKRKQAKKCSLGRPNCGLLHDNMSLMWGGMKDAVDKLDAKMRKEEKAFKKKNDNWNAQISLATGNKETSQGHLSQAMAEQTADSAEQQKKEQEERRLEAEFKKGWAACVRDMNEILFSKFCGVKSARGSLHKGTGSVGPDDLVDCEVSDWVAEPCSVPCDDNEKGGTQVMKREVVQMNNGNGVQCARTEWIKKCNQIKCPVDCTMTNWSGWSSCTTDCGGGVKGRSRSVEIRPRNGGLFCDTLSEATPCNTGSCDRNCRLTRWKMRPCSVSCGGGIEIRKKHVKKPSRGKGKCPRKRNRRRYGKRRCNVHECYGDEECLAKQDVVVAIDGSGSVKEAGFNVLKHFAAHLVSLYRGENEEWVENEETGEDEFKMVTAAQTAIVQFGNGVMLPDNIVGGADIIHPLSNDNKAVADAMEQLVSRRGFTNMAQGLMAADDVFLNGGRKHAQSVVIVISDGRPSFNFQTEVAVRKLRRKGTKIVMVVVKEFLKEDQLKLMKKWSSVPRITNFIHIPGLKKLRDNMDWWTNRVLIRACSKTISLRKEAEQKDMWEAASAMEDLAEYTEPPESMFLAKKH